MRPISPAAMRRLGLLLGALTLSGCASVCDDPTQGGFFGGLCGIRSGTYQADTQARQNELDQLQLQQQNLEDEKDRLSAAQQDAEAQVARLQGQIDQLERSIQTLGRDIDGLSATAAADDQRIGQLRAELGRLRSEIEQLENQPADQPELRRALELRATELNREYELLLQLYLDLAE